MRRRLRNARDRRNLAAKQGGLDAPALQPPRRACRQRRARHCRRARRPCAQAKPPIGIIGAGNIGGAVGALWVKAGHPVMFSSRNPDELKDMVAKLGPLAHAGTVAQAIAFGDALFIAVPYAALPQIGSRLSGRAERQGHAGRQQRGAHARRRCHHQGSRHQRHRRHLAEISRRHAAGARLQHHGRQYLRDPIEPPRSQAGDSASPATMPRRCASPQALVRDAGFEPVLVGGLDSAKKFQQRGGPGYGVAGSAAELKQKLGM